jgi:hypothetical protein
MPLTRLRHLPTAVALFICGALAAACDTPPQRQKFPDITFQHMAPYRLNVAQIVVQQDYRAADHPDDIGPQFPELPETLVADWARDRLQAAGERGQATFTIVDARATQIPLPRASGIDAALKKEQSDKYELAITVKIDAGNPLLGKTGSVTETVTRSQTVAEDLTLNQREVVLFNLLDSAMKDLNARLEQSIPQYLAPLLR